MVGGKIAISIGTVSCTLVGVFSRDWIGVPCKSDLGRNPDPTDIAWGDVGDFECSPVSRLGKRQGLARRAGRSERSLGARHLLAAKCVRSVSFSCVLSNSDQFENEVMSSTPRQLRAVPARGSKDRPTEAPRRSVAADAEYVRLNTVEIRPYCIRDEHNGENVPGENGLAMSSWYSAKQGFFERGVQRQRL